MNFPAFIIDFLSMQNVRKIRRLLRKYIIEIITQAQVYSIYAIHFLKRASCIVPTNFVKRKANMGHTRMQYGIYFILFILNQLL